MPAINYAAIPKCAVCRKRYLIKPLQRGRDCCYSCGRRKLRVYCDHCSWWGRASINGPCPICKAWGRLHLQYCGVLGHFACCGCQEAD